MLTIALTGGIGSGKTAVTGLFHELASKPDFQGSLKIIDADIIARNLLAGSLQEPSAGKESSAGKKSSAGKESSTGKEPSASEEPPSSTALREVQKLFGADLFDSEGYLQRAKLRSLIFSSKDKKQQLEALLHPLVYDEIFSQLSDIHSSNASASQKTMTKIVIIAIPLFFETKAETKAEARTETSSEKEFDRILVIDVPVNLQIERTLKRDNCSSKLVKEIINSQVERQIRLNQADDIIDNSGTLSELKLKVESLFQYYCSLAGKCSSS